MHGLRGGWHRFFFVAVGVGLFSANALAVDQAPIEPQYVAVILDVGGIDVSSSEAQQYEPFVAFDGNDFLAVWRDLRNGPSDIYAGRISRTGESLDGEGFAISDASGDQFIQGLTWGTDHALAVWTDLRSGESDIYGARISSAGTVEEPTGIPISTESGSQADAAVAFDGSNFLVVWDGNHSSGEGIFGARVSAAGQVLDSPPILVSGAEGEQGTPAVSFDGTQFLVAWADARSGTSSDIYGARVTSAGEVVDPEGLPLATGSWEESQPALASLPGRTLLTWTDQSTDTRDIFATFMASDGSTDPGGPIALSIGALDQESSSAAWGQDVALVAWTDWRDEDYPDIFAARIDPAGQVQDPYGAVVSSAPFAQADPQVAYDGESYMLVWSDRRGVTSSQIFATRVGLQLDSDGDDYPDDTDNCPYVPNEQADSDRDGVGTDCDNCPSLSNPDQSDTDGDQVGALCDNCPDTSNPDQEDSDGDGPGDACDNCPKGDNEDQMDTDADGTGDLCDTPDPTPDEEEAPSSDCSCDTSGGKAPSSAPAILLLGLLTLISGSIRRRSR